jgi:threonine aldolase
VLGGAVDARKIRMVTHLDVDRQDVERAVQIIAQVAGHGL